MRTLLLTLPLVFLAACGPKDKADVYAAKPTDTSLNKRDTSGATTTPIDQSNEKADIDHLAEIRKAVTADEQLSTSSKNVKIMTRAGKVTLRGVVPTTAERQRIEDLARACTATHTIDNQIEVETK
jgi:osmotically-inducible protein OsmY